MGETKAHDQSIFGLCGFLCMLYLISISEGNYERCKCPSATVTSLFPSTFPNHTCCLNLSGSSFAFISWDAFEMTLNLQILDLSLCNITNVGHSSADSTPSTLQEIYLSQNQLKFLPQDFLTSATVLEVLDLEENLLEELPVNFLKNAHSLRVVILSGNRLRSLPVTMLKLSLQQLDLMNNPWTCSCFLVKDFHSNNVNSSRLQGIVGNLTCSFPQSLSGKTVWSIQVDDVCRLSGLNALFIIFPLLLLMCLTLCWCCGRKENKKDKPNFSAAHKKNVELFPPLSNQNPKEDMLKKQLMPRPSSELLGSTKDINEEMEIKLGSIESLGCPLSTLSGKEDNQELDSKKDLETLSVTEVMRDSADREKAYMTQSTKYYSLVPGLEIEDSDHGEYESVDLS